MAVTTLTPQNGIHRIEKAYPVIQPWTVPGSACRSVPQWSWHPTLRSRWGMWGLYLRVWRGGVCASYFVWSHQGRLPGGGDSEGTIFGMLLWQGPWSRGEQRFISGRVFFPRLTAAQRGLTSLSSGMTSQPLCFYSVGDGTHGFAQARQAAPSPGSA